MTYYQVLNLQPDATVQQIKDSYRELVKEYHPDKNSSEKAKQLIVLINEAYEVLSDPVKKALYDQQLAGSYISHEAQLSEREAYRMEYIRRKYQEARRKKQNLEKYRKFIYTLTRFINAVLFIGALGYLIDFVIPRKEHDEYAINGWQRTVHAKRISTLHSYMETNHFTMEVPHELHLSYKYYDEPQLLTIKATRMLDVPTSIDLHEGEYVYKYKVLGTVYKYGCVILLLLLINTGFVTFSKYQFGNYIASFSSFMWLLILYL